jgi:hypothetical protein
MLTRQSANSSRYTFGMFILSITRAHRHLSPLLPATLLKPDIPTFPPIQLSHFCDAALFKPRLVAQRREKVRLGKLFLYAQNCRVA